jgi:hypothetical protein
MRKHLTLATLFISISITALSAFTALADEHGGHGDKDKDEHHRGAPQASGAAAASGAPSSAPASSAAAKDDEDDPAAAADESKEDREKRRNYIRRTKRQLDDTLHASTRDLSDDERAAVKGHWRTSMRLWRIRHMAQQSGDKATVAKVDTLLAKADERTAAKLKALQAKAAGGASSAAPAASSSAGNK